MCSVHTRIKVRRLHAFKLLCTIICTYRVHTHAGVWSAYAYRGVQCIHNVYYTCRDVQWIRMQKCTYHAHVEMWSAYACRDVECIRMQKCTYHAHVEMWSAYACRDVQYIRNTNVCFRSYIFDFLPFQKYANCLRLFRFRMI